MFTPFIRIVFLCQVSGYVGYVINTKTKFLSGVNLVQFLNLCLFVNKDDKNIQTTERLKVISVL